MESALTFDANHARVENFAGHGMTLGDLFGPADDVSTFRVLHRQIRITEQITMRLLQWLQTNPHQDYTNEQKLELLDKHKSEFPSKLRPIIDKAVFQWLIGEDEEEGFSLMEDNVRAFFLGRKKNGAGDLSNSLNSQVDTEEEVELLMRFFGPKIDRNAFEFHYCCVLDMMSTEPQAQRFVPLYIRLWGMPYGGIKSKSGVPKAVLNLLRGSGNDLEDETSDAFDALDCLLDNLKEPINRENLKDLIQCILKARKKDVSFIQSRMRFLIRKRPLLLKHCRDYYSLVDFVVQGIPVLWQWVNRDVLWELYIVVAELGLHYYPKDLGFIFHGSNYSASCALWDDDRVGRMVLDNIPKALHQVGVCYPTMVYEAAINEDMSLDGVYTLLCIDPVAVITRLQLFERSRREETAKKPQNIEPVAIATSLQLSERSRREETTKKPQNIEPVAIATSLELSERSRREETAKKPPKKLSTPKLGFSTNKIQNPKSRTTWISKFFGKQSFSKRRTQDKSKPDNPTIQP